MLLFYLIVGAAILAGFASGVKHFWTKGSTKKADKASSRKSYMAEEVNSENIYS